MDPAGEWLDAWVSALQAQCGVTFVDPPVVGHAPEKLRPWDILPAAPRALLDGEVLDFTPQPPPTMPAFRGSARDRLDEILRRVGLGGYLLHPDLDTVGAGVSWGLEFPEVFPTDELVGNRTPILPSTARPWKAPAPPSPPIPWEAYLTQRESEDR